MPEFSHPWFLTAVPALAALWWVRRRSLARWSDAQWRVCAAVRAIGLLLVILALAGMRVRLGSDAVSAVFLVDVSESVGERGIGSARETMAAALRSARVGDRVAVATFAGGIAVAPEAEASADGEWPMPERRDATFLADALSMAGALANPGAARRVVLFSDGFGTGGNAEEAALRAASEGIQIFVVPIAPDPAPEVMLERLDLPAAARPRAPFPVAARIRSNVATRAEVRMEVDGLVVHTGTVSLTPGENRLPLPDAPAGEGAATVEVTVLAEKDTRAENDAAVGFVGRTGQPRILLVDRDRASVTALQGAWKDAGMVVDVRPPEGVPEGFGELAGFDLAVLSGVDALTLGAARMDALERWVREMGGGLVMIGGGDSFGAGGYYKTPIERILPVRMEHDDRLDVPRVALLIVLDRSGSMAAPAGGTTKMALANQGAVLAMEVLQSRDLLGVRAVDTRVHRVVNLAPVVDRAGLEQRIRAITSGGGGIYVYTALLEAWSALREADAKVKHVILFSDAADAEEKFAGEMADGTQGGGTALDVASAMRAEGITTSVVALGSERDRDAEFLEQLAERGAGRYYLTGDAMALPQIFTTETMKVAQSSLVEEPVLPEVVGMHPATDGIRWEEAPPLLGYNVVKAKPAAAVPLQVESGDPLFAAWRYGLGKAAAFTGDAKAAWASEWLGWGGFRSFWEQVARATMRAAADPQMEVAIREEGDALVVAADVTQPGGAFRNGLSLVLNAVGPGGATASASFAQVAPGRYEATLVPPEAGPVFGTVSEAGKPGGVSFSFVRQAGAEFRTMGVDEAVLRRLAELSGGRYAPGEEEIFARPERPVKRFMDLAPWLIGAALALLPLDVLLRRRPWPSARQGGAAA